MQTNSFARVCGQLGSWSWGWGQTARSLVAHNKDLLGRDLLVHVLLELGSTA